MQGCSHNPLSELQTLHTALVESFQTHQLALASQFRFRRVLEALFLLTYKQDFFCNVPLQGPVDITTM